MIATAFDTSWIKNTGKMPVGYDIMVDLLWSRGGGTDNNTKAGEWNWFMSEDCTSITHWRLHKPSLAARLLEQMPTVQPMKTNHAEDNNINNILSAFHGLTGVILTDDQYKTLRVLMEHFQN